MTKKTFLALLLLLTACTCCWAQDTEKKNQLTFGVNFLLHGEACGGGLPKDDESKTQNSEGKSYFLMSRLRLNVDYQRQQYLQAHAVIQNQNVWGTGNSQELNLYEGWVKLSTRFGLFTQVGRIALSYDDERIIGLNDFAMAALSHDVLLAGYEGHGHKAHVILGYNQNGSNVYKSTYYNPSIGSQAYKTMQTVWYHYDVPKFPLGVSLLFMNFGLQAGEEDNRNNPPHMVCQQTYGGYLNFHPKFMTLEGSYYRQSGKNVSKSMEDYNIQAWMASVKATVNLPKNFSVELGYDYLSGDDYVPVIKKGSFGMTLHALPKGFCPLYGSRTKFYGILDFFYESAYINGFTPGLQNAFAGVNATFFSKLDVGATYHYLATATKLDKLGWTLGHSVDFMAQYQIMKDVKIVAGYTHMMGTETMARLKQKDSSEQARWGWFSLVVSPSIFTAKW